MTPDAPHPPPGPSDLTARARIRNAALGAFARRGVEATSIRDIAGAAGVSPGLVQHHFGNKAGLRRAVNEHVISVAVETFAGLFRGDAGSDAWAAMGDTVTDWVRENPVALRYVARALADGDEEVRGVFEALVRVARIEWLEPLGQHGVLPDGVDRDWAALHVIIFNLASVLLEPAISHALGADFFSAEQLQRWNTATTELYRRGLTG